MDGDVMDDALQAVVDCEEITISDESINGAAQILDLAVGRDRFSYNRLLPPDLAAAIELINQEDPADALTATLIFLVGCAGLLKLGNRVRLSARHDVPMNLFIASVGPTGLSKTGHTKKLIDAPSAHIRLDAQQHWEAEVRKWEELCKTIKKKEDRPPKPLPLYPHIKKYTPEALDVWMPHYEVTGQGALIKREEFSALLRAMDADTKRGRGTAEGQFLELFDGGGNTSYGVVAGARHYDASMVSVFGNIQPDVLAELINGKDATGKFARLLCVKVPLVGLNLRDEDETPEEEAALHEARKVLAKYADRFHKSPPRVYKVSADARRYYNHWFSPRNLKAIDPSVPKVIQAMWGKSGAHALRLAGNLHMLWVGEDQEISVELMELAAAIVDQCLQETELFHNQPADRTLRYMQHINSISQKVGDVTYKLSHAKATWKGGRDFKSKDFATCVEKLCDQGYGEVVEGTSPLTYRSLRQMPGDSTDNEKQLGCQPKSTAVQSVSKKRRF
jgi:hypothetical protein